MAPGIVVVFRDKDLEQEVLFRRRSGTMVVALLPRPPFRKRPPAAPKARRERVSVERVPLRFLSSQHVGAQRALDMLKDDLGGDAEFQLASETRRRDLLVHLALTQVPGAPRYKTLPRSIQADIRAFFRSHAAALEEGRRLLFAAGDRSGVRADAEAAAAAGLGGIWAEKSFRFRSSVLPKLPARLRVMVGCAEVLQGGVDAGDFVDIDLNEPRVTTVVCDDIEQPVPFIVERVRVDLGRLKVRADRREPQSTPIYFKSRFLPPDEELRDGQEEFEATLLATGLFVEGQPEPPWEKVQPALKAAMAKR